MKYYVQINAEGLSLDSGDIYQNKYIMLNIGDILLVDSSLGEKIGLKTYFKVTEILSNSGSIVVDSDIYLYNGSIEESIASLIEHNVVIDITKSIERDEKLEKIGII
jgi:hypothetical protein